MCMRASRGLLRLRNGAVCSSSPSVVDIVRTVSTDKPPVGPGSATGGLAQAILQERLQQQQQSQVRRLACAGALDLSILSADGEIGGVGNYTAAELCESPPTCIAPVY